MPLSMPHVASMQPTCALCGQAIFISHYNALSQLPQPDRAKRLTQGSNARDVLCTLLQLDLVGHVDSLVGWSMFFYDWSVSILVQPNKGGFRNCGEPSMGLVDPNVKGWKLQGLLIGFGMRASTPWPLPCCSAHVQAYSVVNSIGFGLGSLLFHIGGLMMLAEQSCKRCQPSLAKFVPSLAEPTKQAGPHAAADHA